MSDQLSQLKTFTTVVADTGDFEAIRQYQPEDATTNPSLILKAVQQDKYRPLLSEALEWANAQPGDGNKTELAADKLAVMLGARLLQQVPGYVSTEVNAHLSFDTMGTIEKAHQLLDLYRQQGVDTDRILIKIAATWEGIQAARVLEQQGVKCNLTLVFSFTQARACAEAGAYLISPFVGRILDWYKASHPDQDFSGMQDPGVQSVTRIYEYFKQHGYNTVVMGASFRNIGEIQCLAGCDRLTISPALLEELANTQGALPRRLQPGETAKGEQPAQLNEADFRWQMNEDPMATEKLAEGIRQFAADQVRLEQLLRQ